MFDILQQQNLTNCLLVLCVVMLGLNMCIGIRSREVILNVKPKEVLTACKPDNNTSQPGVLNT
jgi:hypothetical protein